MPPVWIVGDDTALVATAARAIGLSNVKILALADAQAAFDDYRPDGLVAIVVDRMSPQLEAVIARVEADAYDARRPALILCRLDDLDAVAALVSAPHATIACDAAPVDLAIALRWSHRGSGSVAETDRDADTVRLHKLTDEIARIARALTDLAAGDAGGAAVSDGLRGYRTEPAARPDGVAVTGDEVRRMIRWRRRRDTLFTGDLFADPAWDMMLDLVAARLERSDVAVSSLCIAAAVPATTALRWIKTLTDIGVFVRVADTSDRRRVFIALSEAAATALLVYLGEAKAAGVV